MHKFKSNEYILYNKILRLSRNKLFYTKFALEDTFQNRISLIFFHISLSKNIDRTNDCLVAKIGFDPAEPRTNPASFGSQSSQITRTYVWITIATDSTRRSHTERLVVLRALKYAEATDAALRICSLKKTIENR